MSALNFAEAEIALEASVATGIHCTICMFSFCWFLGRDASVVSFTIATQCEYLETIFEYILKNPNSSQESSFSFGTLQSTGMCRFVCYAFYASFLAFLDAIWDSFSKYYVTWLYILILILKQSFESSDCL